MKKRVITAVCLLVAIAIGFGVFTASVSAGKYAFRVGYGKRDIMPLQDALPLGGYGNSASRPADLSLTKAQYDRLQTTCVVMADENDTRIAIVGIDALNVHEYMSKAAKRKIRLATGIPEENILINATHSHSTPDVNLNADNIGAYVEYMTDQIREAAVEAVADLQEVDTVRAGSIKTSELNYTRHYYYSFFGNTEYYGNNFGTTHENHSIHVGSSGYIHTMHVICFNRANGAKPVYMVNFRMHPTTQGSSGSRKITADVIGTFRAYMEGPVTKEDGEVESILPDSAKEGVLVSYCQGAAGMINAGSTMKTERQDYADEMVTVTDVLKDGVYVGREVRSHVIYGKNMAQYALDCIANSTISIAGANLGPITVMRQTYTGTTNRDKSEYYNAAKAVLESGNLEAAENKKAGSPIRSLYQANAIITRAELPDQREMEIAAFSIGKTMVFSAVPFEMFHQCSDWLEWMLKDDYKMAFSMGYCEDTNGYMPVCSCFTYTSYETDITRWVKGTAEKVTEQLYTMITGKTAKMPQSTNHKDYTGFNNSGF